MRREGWPIEDFSGPGKAFAKRAKGGGVERRSVEFAPAPTWTFAGGPRSRHSGKITKRKVDGWRSLTEKPCDQAIDLAA